MTTWQWRVILALVRMVLRARSADLSGLYDEDKILDDENILVEAVMIIEP